LEGATAAGGSRRRHRAGSGGSINAAAVHSWTGNHAGIAEISERDLARLRRERPPVIENADADGITLIGEEPSSLFRKRR